MGVFFDQAARNLYIFLGFLHNVIQFNPLLSSVLGPLTLQALNLQTPEPLVKSCHAAKNKTKQKFRKWWQMQSFSNRVSFYSIVSVVVFFIFTTTTSFSTK